MKVTVWCACGRVSGKVGCVCMWRVRAVVCEGVGCMGRARVWGAVRCCQRRV